MRLTLALALVALLAGGGGAPPVAHSQLGQALSAAFRDFVEDGSAYSDLYTRYMGVAPPRLPDVGDSGDPLPRAEVDPTSDLGRVLATGRIRLGFYEAAPYHFRQDGRFVGFDRDLAEALVERLRRHYPDCDLQAEWVECTPTGLTGGGRDAYAVRDQFQAWLEEGRFDVAFSGLIVQPGKPVDTVCRTMLLFEDALYTGRGDLDLGGLASREELVAAMARIPDCLVLSTPGGPSEEAVAGLVAEVRAAGGAVTPLTATVPDLRAAVSGQTVHFVIGDGVALSALSAAPGFAGRNLNFDVAPAFDEYLGPFCRQVGSP